MTPRVKGPSGRVLPRRTALKRRTPLKSKRSRKKAKPKKPTRRSLTRKADLLWARYIKQRDGGCCISCGTTDSVQAAHIVSRWYRLTRHLPENGIALCAREHLFWTHHPLEFEAWIEERFGPGSLSNLKRRALRVDVKPDVEAAIENLEALLAGME